MTRLPECCRLGKNKYTARWMFNVGNYQIPLDPNNCFMAPGQVLQYTENIHIDIRTVEFKSSVLSTNNSRRSPLDAILSEILITLVLVKRFIWARMSHSLDPDRLYAQINRQHYLSAEGYYISNKQWSLVKILINSLAVRTSACSSESGELIVKCHH